MNHFANPNAAFLLLLPLLIYFILPQLKKNLGASLRVPFVTDIINIQNQAKSGLLTKPSVAQYAKMFLMMLIWGLMVLALCRPQWVGKPLPVQNEGRDILLVVDISNSMTEADFEFKGKLYTRMDAVKNVVNDFVEKRTVDRMGLVLFGSQAYLQVPLTYDKQSLKDVLWSMDAGMAGNSTSIGDAIGVALKSLASEGGEPDNKVIVLLTDGENNDGSLSLPQAIKLAKEEKIKVYTIGVGSGTANFFGGFISIPVNSGLDEKSLKALAQETKGNYFRAKNVADLFAIYNKIDKLEPRTSEGRYVQEVKELYVYPAAWALGLFMLLILWLKKGR